VQTKIYSSKSSKGIDLDSAAAVENDENMIINSDLTIITTPVESPQTDDTDKPGPSSKVKSPDHKSKPLQTESDDILSSETSSSEAPVVNKRHRPKARSDSNRSQKYAKKFDFYFDFFPFQLGVPFQVCSSFLLDQPLSVISTINQLAFL
jgi:hypothetical protein